MRVARSVARKLRPHRVITEKDTGDGKYVALRQRLCRDEFNMPLLEKYEGNSFYGMYDMTKSAPSKISPYFCERAAAFLEDVARALPHAIPENVEREIYPQIENRKIVTSHLQRERSRLLATECKIRDGYECQVCRMKFEKNYGKIGKAFAEAHHLVPLGKLNRQTKTHLKDSVTVCANCHRMLHKMEGKRDDVSKLKRIVRELA